MDSKVVSSLEDLAFESSFKDIMTTLNLCHNDRPKGRRAAPHSSFSKLFLTSENLRSFVRGQLNCHLVGVVSQKVREKYVNRFYDFLSNGRKTNQIDVWVFLDAVLDDSCKELKTFIALPSSKVPDDMLVPTIVKWSPLVEKLTINCDPIDFCEDDIDEIDGTLVGLVEAKSTFRSLRSLQHLTHLCLPTIWNVQRFAVLSVIGKACPSLSHLGVHAESMGKNDILALIFGEFVNDLMGYSYDYVRSSWCESESLEHLELPSKYLTPICSTLRELQLYYDGSEDDNSYNDIDASAAAFALRHLPLLQMVDKSFPTSLAVIKLHNSSVSEQEESREKFQRAIQEASERSGNTNAEAQNLKATNFTGMLYLTKLDFVNVKYEAMLRAVGETCPTLKEVTFCDASYQTDWEAFTSKYNYYDDPIELENVLDPVNLQAILNRWPKLTKIGFNKVPLEYMTPILEVFGAGVQHLEFKHCDGIELADLALCQQLKSLRILSSSMFLLEDDDLAFDADTFLPQLNSFHSDVCLGLNSRFFEEKSTLVRLVLHCSHAKIEVDGSEPLQKRLKHAAEANFDSGLGWIRQLWSNLEVLAIFQFSQLSMAALSDLIPHLRNLKLVTLPERISSIDPTLVHSMRDQLLSRNPPAKLSFEDCNSKAWCEIAEHA